MLFANCGDISGVKVILQLSNDDEKDDAAAMTAIEAVRV